MVRPATLKEALDTKIAFLRQSREKGGQAVTYNGAVDELLAQAQQKALEVKAKTYHPQWLDMARTLSQLLERQQKESSKSNEDPPSFGDVGSNLSLEDLEIRWKAVSSSDELEKRLKEEGFQKTASLFLDLVRQCQSLLTHDEFFSDVIALQFVANQIHGENLHDEQRTFLIYLHDLGLSYIAMSSQWSDCLDGLSDPEKNRKKGSLKGRMKGLGKTFFPFLREGTVLSSLLFPEKEVEVSLPPLPPKMRFPVEFSVGNVRYLTPWQLLGVVFSPYLAEVPLNDLMRMSQVPYAFGSRGSFDSWYSSIVPAGSNPDPGFERYVIRFHRSLNGEEEKMIFHVEVPSGRFAEDSLPVLAMNVFYSCQEHNDDGDDTWFRPNISLQPDAHVAKPGCSTCIGTVCSIFLGHKTSTYRMADVMAEVDRLVANVSTSISQDVACGVGKSKRLGLLDKDGQPLVFATLEEILEFISKISPGFYRSMSDAHHQKVFDPKLASDVLYEYLEKVRGVPGAQVPEEVEKFLLGLIDLAPLIDLKGCKDLHQKLNKSKAYRAATGEDGESRKRRIDSLFLVLKPFWDYLGDLGNSGNHAIEVLYCLTLGDRRFTVVIDALGIVKVFEDDSLLPFVLHKKRENGNLVLKHVDDQTKLELAPVRDQTGAPTGVFADARYTLSCFVHSGGRKPGAAVHDLFQSLSAFRGGKNGQLQGCDLLAYQEIYDLISIFAGINRFYVMDRDLALIGLRRCDHEDGTPSMIDVTHNGTSAFKVPIPVVGEDGKSVLGEDGKPLMVWKFFFYSTKGALALAPREGEDYSTALVLSNPVEGNFLYTFYPGKNSCREVSFAEAHEEIRKNPESLLSPEEMKGLREDQLPALFGHGTGRPHSAGISSKMFPSELVPLFQTVTFLADKDAGKVITFVAENLCCKLKQRDQNSATTLPNVTVKRPSAVQPGENDSSNSPLPTNEAAAQVNSQTASCLFDLLERSGDPGDAVCCGNCQLLVDKILTLRKCKTGNYKPVLVCSEEQGEEPDRCLYDPQAFQELRSLGLPELSELLDKLSKPDQTRDSKLPEIAGKQGQPDQELDQLNSWIGVLQEIFGSKFLQLPFSQMVNVLNSNKDVSAAYRSIAVLAPGEDRLRRQGFNVEKIHNIPVLSMKESTIGESGRVVDNGMLQSMRLILVFSLINYEVFKQNVNHSIMVDTTCLQAHLRNLLRRCLNKKSGLPIESFATRTGNDQDRFTESDLDKMLDFIEYFMEKIGTPIPPRPVKPVENSQSKGKGKGKGKGQ